MTLGIVIMLMKNILEVIKNEYPYWSYMDTVEKYIDSAHIGNVSKG